MVLYWWLEFAGDSVVPSMMNTQIKWIHTNRGYLDKKLDEGMRRWNCKRNCHAAHWSLDLLRFYKVLGRKPSGLPCLGVVVIFSSYLIIAIRFPFFYFWLPILWCRGFCGCWLWFLKLSQLLPRLGKLLFEPLASFDFLIHSFKLGPKTSQSGVNP